MGKISGSITLKRLKKGVNVVLTIQASKPMYQGYDPKQGKVSPDFTTADNQPILTPTAVAGNGQTASITQGQWYYNGTLLTANGSATATNNFTPCTDARFAICLVQSDTNYLSLRIIGNVASAGNMSNDILTFDGGGEVQGVDWTAKTSIELHLQEIGSSAAQLLLSTDRATLNKTNTSATLTATLIIGGNVMDSGYTFVFKDESGEPIQSSTSNTCEITRDNITAIGGIWVSAYLGTDTTKEAVATAYQAFVDMADDYELTVTVDKDWDGTNKQTVTAHLYHYSAENGVGNEVTGTELTGTFTHVFKGATSQTKLYETTGKTVEVKADNVWGATGISDTEDVIDYVSYSV